MRKPAKKTKGKKARSVNYNDKLTVNGSFLDIMKAAVKDADNKSTKKPS